MPRTKSRLYSWKEITLSLVEGGLVAKGDEIGLLLLGRLIGLISDFGRVNSLGRFELPSSYYYHFMGFSMFHFWEKGKFYLYNMWRKPHHFLSTQVNKASSSTRPSFILSPSYDSKLRRKNIKEEYFLRFWIWLSFSSKIFLKRGWLK